MIPTSVIILFGYFITLFWLALYLLEWKKFTYTKKIWFVALIFMSCYLYTTAYYWQPGRDYRTYCILDVIDTFAILSFIPIVYFYIHEATGDKSPVFWKMALMFAPALVCSISITIIFLQVGGDRSPAFMQSIIEGTTETNQDLIPYRQAYYWFSDIGYRFSMLVLALIVAIYGIVRVRNYNNALNAIFANRKNFSIFHHWYALLTMIAFLFFIVFGNLANYTLYVKHDMWVPILMILFTLILFKICFHIQNTKYTGLVLTEEMLDEEQDAFDYEKMKTLYIEPSEYQKLVVAFNKLIDEDKIFLKVNLRLEDVVVALKSKRAYISRIVMQEYNTDFWTFIDRKRIDHAVELLEDDPTLLMNTIALMCGFPDIIVFSHAFYHFKGTSFTYWKRMRN